MHANIIPVATGDAWIGYGVRSFRSVISELITNSLSKLIMTAYVLTNIEIVEEIRGALNRGVVVEIYLYDDGKEITQTEAVHQIINLKQEFPYLDIIFIKSKVLHAKIIIADSRVVLVGSANLTLPAMVSNYEMGFLIDDPGIAGKLTDLVYKMRSA